MSLEAKVRPHEWAAARGEVAVMRAAFEVRAVWEVHRRESSLMRNSVDLRTTIRSGRQEAVRRRTRQWTPGRMASAGSCARKIPDRLVREDPAKWSVSMRRPWSRSEAQAPWHCVGSPMSPEREPAKVWVSAALRRDAWWGSSSLGLRAGAIVAQRASRRVVGASLLSLMVHKVWWEEKRGSRLGRWVVSGTRRGTDGLGSDVRGDGQTQKTVKEETVESPQTRWGAREMDLRKRPRQSWEREEQEKRTERMGGEVLDSLIKPERTETETKDDIKPP